MMARNPHISLRQIKQKSLFGLNRRSVLRIVTNLYYPYHLSLYQEMHKMDFVNRGFCQ